MTPYLSVIVAVYNAEAFLEQCLDSILSQTFRDFELILVDDGSRDNSSAICDAYQKKDARIRVIHQPNGGVVRARKVGAKAATGEYVTYVDSDDWIDKDMYQVMWELAIRHGADVIATDLVEERPGLSVRNGNLIAPGFYSGKALKEMQHKMLYSGRFFSCGILPALCGKWIRRRILLPHVEAMDEQIVLGEDMTCTCLSILDADAVEIYGEKAFYHYRFNPSSITKDVKSENYKRFDTLYRHLESRLSERHAQDALFQLNYHKVFTTTYGMESEVRNIKDILTGKSSARVKDRLNDPYLRNTVKDVPIEKMDVPFLYASIFRAIRKKRVLTIVILSEVARIRKYLPMKLKKFSGNEDSG